MSGITEYLGFEYKILPAELTPDGLMSFYKAELERGRQEGFTPVIIPVEDNLEEYLEELGDFEKTPERTASDFFIKRMEEYGKEDVKERFGEMTEGDINEYMVSLNDYDTGKLSECVMIYLPTDKPWETAFLVPFGGWNECPEPEDMAAVLKYWYEEYGAVPAAITHDTLELVLPKPVPRKRASLLATEQYLFCNDRVDQCTQTGTIGELAGDLSVSTVWYFWWD